MTDPSQNRKKKITIIASPQGVERAENALIRLGFDSKSNFAKSQLLARNTVTKFFQRQPIQLDSFKRICEALKLKWIDIAEEEQSERIERKYSSSLETNEEVGQMQTLHRKVTVIDKQSKKKKAEIILKGDLNSVHNLEFIQFILQQHSGDTITITDIQEGSIRLIVEGSQEDIERLISQFESGELTQVNGFPVEDAQILSEISDDDESNELDDKWRLVQEIVSQPVKGRNLRGADLSDVDLSGADLSGADLSGADLSGADLRGANLSDTDLSSAIIDSQTKLDDVHIPVENIQLLPGETLDNNESLIQDGAVDTSGSQNLIFRHNRISVKLIFANLIRCNLDGAFRILINLFSANLKGVYLRGLYLRGVYLRGANLIGADLSDANLSSADLSNTNLIGTDLRSNLRGANLSHANLWIANLSHANLSHADLNYANLSHADLNHADLNYANLSHADLNHADLSHADLSHADLNHADLSLAYLKGAVINKETRIDGKWRFIWEIVNQGAVCQDLSNANLSGSNLSGSNLSGSNLSGSNLSGSNLSGSNLSGSNLSNSNLSGSNLSGADLSNSNLSGSNLSGIDLSGANLSGANLINGNLRRAIVVYALFIGSKGLTEDNKRDLKQRGAIFGDEQRKTIFSDSSPVPKPK